MFVDLDWPLNASSLLSASAELLVTISCCVYCNSKPLSLRFINFIIRLILYLYICCINSKCWNWYIVQCFMIVIYHKCIVTILLLTNRCTVMTLGKVMICIFIISRNQLAKELFSIILEVFCGIQYHQFLKMHV